MIDTPELLLPSLRGPCRAPKERSYPMGLAGLHYQAGLSIKSPTQLSEAATNRLYQVHDPPTNAKHRLRRRGIWNNQEKSEMRKFDPWPVFFKREWNRNWPFLVGFAITGAIITKFSLGLTGNLSLQPDLFISNPRSKTLIFFFFLTPLVSSLIHPEEDAKNSPFVQRHKRYLLIFISELNYSSYYSIAVK